MTAPTAVPALVAVRGVTVAYGGLRALDQVDLDVPDGQVLGLIGPNGAGKTTLLECIAGSVRPDAGTVHYRGRDVTRLGPAAHARLGIVRSFQDARLFPGLTVHQVLSLAHERRSPSHLLLDLVGLPPSRHRERRIAAEADDLAAAFGLTDHVDKLVAELSSGLRRAVDLACATALSPSLLLLDEPSAGLAQAEVGALPPVIRRVRSLTGGTIVIVEHDMPLLMGLADTVAVLDAGRLIALGPPDAIRRDPAVIEAYGAV
jgi:ABC-type branched-subunit amino acid transport system ATPase component